MSWVLDVDVRGAHPAAMELEALGERISDARPAFQRIADALLTHTRRRFAAQPWVPLDPETIRRKVRKGQSPRILRATGTLERALTVRGAPGQRLDISRDELVYGLEQQGDAYYGAFHQRGRGVPKREVIKPTRTLRDRVVEALRNHLLGR